MLIFSIIVMCAYLCSVCQVSRIWTNTYFKEYLSVAASKYTIWDMENNNKDLILYSMFEHSANGKGIIVPNVVYSKWYCSGKL